MLDKNQRRGVEKKPADLYSLRMIVMKLRWSLLIPPNRRVCMQTTRARPIQVTKPKITQNCKSRIFRHHGGKPRGQRKNGFPWKCYIKTNHLPCRLQIYRPIFPTRKTGYLSDKAGPDCRELWDWHLASRRNVAAREYSWSRSTYLWLSVFLTDQIHFLPGRCDKFNRWRPKLW